MFRLEVRARRNIGIQLDRLEDTVLRGRDYDCDYEKILRSITAKDVQKMAASFAAGDILKEIYQKVRKSLDLPHLQQDFYIPVLYSPQ